MILVFILFTLLSLYIKSKRALNIQECIPFYIATVVSWIAFFLYFYLKNEVHLLITYEIASLVIVFFFGEKLEEFFQIKFISYFLLSLAYILEGSFNQDIMFLYVVVSIGYCLRNEFKKYQDVAFPFVLLNMFTLMKAREIVESSLSVDFFMLGFAFAVIVLIIRKLRGFNTRSLFLLTLMWIGVFTLSIDLIFLFISVFTLLLISLANIFNIKTIDIYNDILLYIMILVLIISLSKVSMFLAVICLATSTACLFVNRRNKHCELSYE